MCILFLYKIEENGLLTSAKREARRNEYIKFVDDTMRRFYKHKLRIQKFKLLMDLEIYHRTFVITEWIRLAMKSKLKELEFIQIKLSSSTSITE